MDALLSIESIKEISEKIQLNVPKTAIVDDELVILIKTTLEKVNAIKNANSITVECLYDKELNGFTIILSPAENMAMKNLNDWYIERGIAGFISAKNNDLLKLLREVAISYKTIQFYVFDEDVNVVSVKNIFSTEISKSLILRELQKLTPNDFER